MANRKVIVKVKGGIGNQLFCYAAALRLALANNAELVVDNISGFIGDQYNREYELGKFNIRGRIANKSERFEPWGRYKRRLYKKINTFLPFNKRKYIAEKGLEFKPRLLDIKVENIIYLDGYWQSENYFIDVEKDVRKDFNIISPNDQKNRSVSDKINKENSVVIHIRWFDKPDCNGSTSNISNKYYKDAIRVIKRKVKDPHFFIFSDNPEAAADLLELENFRFTIVNHNKEKAFADLWLMSQSRYFIIANSTFSWWGAWLSEHDDKLVIAPDANISGVGNWGFTGLIPERWIRI